MNLRQIEVFRAVMRTGSTTDAARLLHVSQPGISRMIGHLQLRLGVRLFERHKGRLVATPEAHALHAEIERVYRGVEKVQTVASQLRFGTKGSLRVLASANVGLQVVPWSVAALLNEAPNAHVAFETVPAREVLELLVAEEADIALSSAPLDHPALESRQIGSWRLVCAIPDTHPLAAKASLSMATILKERLVLYGSEAPQSKAIESWISDHAIQRNVAVEVRSGFAACAMAAAGVGIAFPDDLSARAHLAAGLVFREIAARPAYPVYAIVNAHLPLSKLGQRFMEISEGRLEAIGRTRFCRGSTVRR